jgi:hypothetical protein
MEHFTDPVLIFINKESKYSIGVNVFLLLAVDHTATSKDGEKTIHNIMLGFVRLPPRCVSGLRSSGILHIFLTDVPGQPVVLIFLPGSINQNHLGFLGP